jgi:hypothetical protein
MKILPSSEGHTTEMPKGKICLFKNYYMPILTYGAETWTMANINRLTAE